MTSILKANQEARSHGDEMRMPGEAYPKVWAHLGFKSLLMQFEKDLGREDPYMSADA